MGRSEEPPAGRLCPRCSNAVPRRCVKNSGSSRPRTAAALCRTAAVCSCMRSRARVMSPQARGTVRRRSRLGSDHGWRRFGLVIADVKPSRPIWRQLPWRFDPVGRQPCRRHLRRGRGVDGAGRGAAVFECVRSLGNVRRSCQCDRRRQAWRYRGEVGNLPGGSIPVPATAVMAKEIDPRGSFRFGVGPILHRGPELIADGSIDVCHRDPRNARSPWRPTQLGLRIDRSQKRQCRAYSE